MENYKVEREVNLRDISANVLKAWKKILIVIVLLVVVLSGYSIKKAKTNAVASDVTSVAKSLTNEQKNEAEETFAQYKYYYEQNQNFSQKAGSFINTLDPYNTPMVQIELVISTNISNPVTYFQNLNLTDDQMNQISNLLNLDETTSVQDLIFISDGAEKSDANSVNLITGDKTTNIIFDLKMIGVSQDNFSAVADILMDAVNNETNTLLEKGYSISATEVSRNWSESYSQEVVDYQSNYSSQYDKIKSQLKDLQSPSSLTGDTLVYYQALVKDYVKSEKTASVSVFSAKKGIKYLLVSIILAIILAYLVEIVRYMKSHTVKTAGDLVLADCGPVLGIVVPAEKKKKLFTKQIRNLAAPGVAAPDAALKLASIEIARELEKNHLRSIFICCDGEDADTKKTIDQLSVNLKDKFTIQSGSPAVNADALEKFTESDAVVFAATAWATPDNILAKEVHMAKRYGQVLIGSILIKKLD